jgi:hypothetical protein
MDGAENLSVDTGELGEKAVSAETAVEEVDRVLNTVFMI